MVADALSANSKVVDDNVLHIGIDPMRFVANDDDSQKSRDAIWEYIGFIRRIVLFTQAARAFE